MYYEKEVIRSLIRNNNPHIFKVLEGKSILEEDTRLLLKGKRMQLNKKLQQKSFFLFSLSPFQMQEIVLFLLPVFSKQG